jgi:hypothetical protein
MSLLSWLGKLRTEFRDRPASKKLAIVADVVSILGVSFVAIFSAAVVQISSGAPVDIPGALLLLFMVDIALVVLVGLTGLLSYARDTWSHDSTYARLLFFGLQAAIWLAALATAAAPLPDAVQQLVLGGARRP